MKKVLWVSLTVPYDTVPHAGGKVENYYLKGLKNTNDDIRLLTFSLESEREKIDLDNYGIENEIKFYADDYSRVLRMIDIYRYIIKTTKRYKKEGYNPEIIVLQWTQIAFLAKWMKKLFPNAKIIMVEEDVTFLAYKRFYKYHKNLFLKMFYYMAYKAVKYKELQSVRISDLTICNNKKDINLLVDAGIDKAKLHDWVVFYQNLSSFNYEGNSNTVIFYGAMGRPENYKSVEWFIDNVMPLLADVDVKFVVVGGGVKDFLKERECDKVKFTGFVEDLEPYFTQAICLAAPLVLGAGIKVKVLEAMSAGLPVITNEIGIEGIYGTDGVDYIHAETPQEYADAIKKLISDSEFRASMSKQALKHIDVNFNLKTSLEEFQKIVENI